jgi:hypothetical protein
MGFEAPPVGHPAIRRAMCAIAKRELFVSRPKMFIERCALVGVWCRSSNAVLCCRSFVSNMVRAVQRGVEDSCYGMLWLVTYAFLLRMPSEVRAFLPLQFASTAPICRKALPMCKCTPDSLMAAGAQTIVWREGDTVCIRMLRRKNRQHGSGVLKRVCTCKGDPLLCVVHMLWDKFLANLPDGARPWAHISPGTARSRLHQILHVLRVPSAKSYGTHDFRRGHAEDMRLSGCSLAEILAAGQWKSSAFVRYINEVRFVLLPSALRVLFAHVRQNWRKMLPLQLQLRATRKNGLTEWLLAGQCQLPNLHVFCCKRMLSYSVGCCACISTRFLIVGFGCKNLVFHLWRGGRAHPTYPRSL